MKLLCPACERLVELERFRVDGDALLLTCGKCGVESRVTPTAGAAPPPGAGLSGGPSSTAQSSPPPGPGGASSAGPAVAAPRPIPPPRPVSFSSSPQASNVVTLRTPSVAAVERAAQAALEDPFAVPQGLCPRCLAPNAEGATQCGGCGVTFAQIAPAALAPPEWLATTWRELLSVWGDDKRHEAVRTLAYEREDLAALGRLYRLRLAWTPDDPWALKGRDEVLRLAVAPVASRTPDEPRTPPWKYLAVGLVLLFVVVVFVTLVRTVLQSVAGTGSP